jgi:hypothetical protein
MGAKLWYRSCPAVSHISNFTVSSLTARVCEKKAAPMVDSCSQMKQHIQALTLYHEPAEFRNNPPFFFGGNETIHI